MPTRVTKQITRLLVFAIWPVLVTAQHQAGDLTDVLAEARALITEGKPAEAIAKLAPLAASDAPEVRQLLGVAYYHANDAENAVEELEPAIERLPEDSVARREAEQVLGLSLYLTGRMADAILHLERTRKWAPHNQELGYVLGMAYIQTKQVDRAREAFAGLFDVASDSAAAHLLLAQLMIRIQMDDLAEPELRKAVETDGRLPHAHYLLGQIAIFRGRLDEGAALTRREIEINPGHAMALYQLGDAYTRQAKWDEAIAVLQQSLWLNPYYSGPYILLGRAYFSKGEAATAEGMLRRAIQYDPNNRSAHYLLGQVLQQAGRSDEAKEAFEAAERLRSQPLR
jgi:tetratricopeptide (TPR) repeat protein